MDSKAHLRQSTRQRKDEGGDMVCGEKERKSDRCGRQGQVYKEQEIHNIVEDSWRKKPADESGQKMVFFNCWKMRHIAIRCPELCRRVSFIE